MMTQHAFDCKVRLVPKMYATFKIVKVPEWAEGWGVKKGMLAYYIESKDTLAIMKKNGTAFPINLTPSYLKFHDYLTAEGLIPHAVDFA
jgi:hypothetical protein